MTYVSRNPFAREELHKEREYGALASCAWCGGQKVTPNGREYLFRYRVETDGGRKSGDRKLFCSLQCRRDYHE